MKRLLIAALLVLSAGARAEDNPHALPLDSRDVLTGDWGGARSAMEDRGYRLGLNLTAEVFATAGGGQDRDAIYEDLVEAVFDADLQKAMDWDGALFHVNGYLTHGRGLSAHDLGNNLLTVSNIEADRGGRLFDLWLQQTFLKGAATLRIGQIAAAEEFFVSTTASLFLNGTYGWPAVMSANLPGGGPTYPLATPGARLAYAMTDKLSFAAGIYNGDPSGPGPGSPLARDISGTNFRIDGGAFAVVEAAYKSGDSIYKIGAWFHGDRFDDLGPSPATSHHGNRGIYAVTDAALWRADQDSLNGFVRVAAVPGDRNLIAAYGDAGLTYKRADGDTIGLAFAYAGAGSAARQYDRAIAAGDPTHPIRDFESNVELTYQTSLVPWLILQPDIQYVIHPGAHAAPVIPDALAVGLRSVIVF